MNELDMAKALMSQPGGNPGQTTTVYGRASADSANGLVMVDLGGDTVSPDDDQSIECETTFKVYAGDEVIVSLIGADGSGKTPIVVGVVGRGDQQQEEIDNVKNYFWTDSRGAHVSTEAQSVNGSNVLVDADSLDIRYGTANDENSQTVLARFGRDSAFIGGLDGTQYWKIKDLRNPSTGLAVIEDTRYGDGIETDYQTDFNASEITGIKLNGTTMVEDTDYTVDLETSTVTFATAPGVNDVVVITYHTAEGVFAYSEGIREAGAEGAYSKATGMRNKASGVYSQAHGYATEASGWGAVADGFMTRAKSRLQKVSGQLNVADSNDQYAEIVGNGESKTIRETEIFVTDGETDTFTLAHAAISVDDADSMDGYTEPDAEDAEYFDYTVSYVPGGYRFQFDPLPYNAAITFRIKAKAAYSWQGQQLRDEKFDTVILEKGSTECELYTFAFINVPIGLVQITESSMALKAFLGFPVEISGTSITIPADVSSAYGLVIVISYTYGTIVRGNAYNLDWNGNAEYQGEVYLGGCRPNGETPYPAVRYNTGEKQEEYYDGNQWKATPSGLILVTKGEITDETVVSLEFDEAGGFYLLATKEYNASTKAYRGHHLYFIVTPEEDLFGTVAVARINAAASSNAGVTVTNVADSTVQVKRSSATYAVRYALYKMGIVSGIGAPGSDPIPAYTGSYEVDPSFELQTLETSGKQMTDDVDVNAIEVSTTTNPAGGNTVYIGGEIAET